MSWDCTQIIVTPTFLKVPGFLISTATDCQHSHLKPFVVSNWSFNTFYLSATSSYSSIIFAVSKKSLLPLRDWWGDLTLIASHCLKYTIHLYCIVWIKATDCEETEPFHLTCCMFCFISIDLLALKSARNQNLFYFVNAISEWFNAYV